MLVCGCFQIPIFIYHKLNSRAQRGAENMPDTFSTAIFIPNGEGGASTRRRSGITLPFNRNTLCIILEQNHFQWLKVKDDHTLWSECICNFGMLVDAVNINLNLDVLSTACEARHPEALYRRYASNQVALDEEEKKCVAQWLRETCKKYRGAIMKLEGHEQQIRACAWSPFCRKLAVECGGWTRAGCKYRNNLHLPHDYEEVMERHRKGKSHATVKEHRLRKRDLEDVPRSNKNSKRTKDEFVTMKCALEEAKLEVVKIKKEKKDIEEKLRMFKLQMVKNIQEFQL